MILNILDVCTTIGPWHYIRNKLIRKFKMWHSTTTISGIPTNQSYRNRKLHSHYGYSKDDSLFKMWPPFIPFGWVGLSPLVSLATNWRVLSVPYRWIDVFYQSHTGDDCEAVSVRMRIGRGNCCTNPIWSGLESNLGLHSGKLVINRLSYGMATWSSWTHRLLGESDWELSGKLPYWVWIL